MKKMKYRNILHMLLCVILGILGVGGLVFYLVFSMMDKQIDLGYLAFIIKYHIEIVIVSIICCFLFFILLIIRNRKIETRRLKIKHLCFSLLSVLICPLIILFIFEYSVQDELINKNNLIFRPAREVPYIDVGSDIEAISLTTSDKIKLNGWFVKSSKNVKAPLIIYFGGSGQEVSEMIECSRNQLKGYDVALINYRGFGKSEGSPSQDTVFNDAILIYDTFSKREDVDDKKIFTMGWSLGTAVSVYLSEHRPIKGTILVAPFDSFQPAVPFIPPKLIMKQFDSVSRAPLITTPLLCLIGDSDINVPPSSSQKLVQSWKGSHTVKIYKNKDHFLLYNCNIWTDINNFLNDLN